MNKGMATALQARAAEVAGMFSEKTRGGNFANETFEVDEIRILSESTACVVYRKEPTKKKAVAWFYYVNSRAQPRWEYFFLTYNHLVGLDAAASILHEVEQHNFKTLTGERHE